MPYRNSRLRRNCLVMIALGSSLVFTVSPRAQDQKAGPKLTLRAIMAELGAEYLQLSGSLLSDDFSGLERSAKAIQGHPLPADIVAAIKAKLGKNFRTFELVDEQSHQAAADLAKRAIGKDITGSARAYGRLTEGCVSCHKRFRAALRSLSD